MLGFLSSLSDQFRYTGLELYEAIESGNLNKVRTITTSFFRPHFKHVCKKDAEQNLLIVAGNNRKILAYLLEVYGHEFSYDYRILGLIHSIQHDYFQLLKIELRRFMNVTSSAHRTISFQKSKKLYLALTSDEDSSDKIAQGIKKLANANFPYIDNEKLYHAVIDNPFYADRLTQNFVRLTKAKLYYQDHQNLYQAIIDRSYYANEMTLGFVILTNANFCYQNHQKLYHALIEKPSYAGKLAHSFVHLAITGLSYLGNEKFYHAIIDQPTPFLITRLVNGFVALANANLSYQELFQAIIDQPPGADRLEDVFVQLANANIPYQNNKKLYEAIINAISPSQLACGFIELAKANLSYHTHKKLYQALIKYGFDASTLAQGFVVLTKANLLYQQNKKLYRMVIAQSDTAKKLAQGLVKLANANIFYPSDKKLYSALIDKSNSLNLWLIQGLVLLANAQLPYRDNEKLYHLLIDNRIHASTLAQAFIALAAVKFFYQGNEKFYQSIIDRRVDIEKLLTILNFFLSIGVSYSQHPEYFNLNLLTHDGLAIHTLNTLIIAGYSLKWHKSVFDKLLTELSKEKASYQLILNIVNQLKAYTQKNSLLMPNALEFEGQLETLEAIADGFNSLPWDSLTEGPLNKSEATVAIEDLLEQISQINVDSEEPLISFNDQEHYILKLPTQAEVNLSLLINNANLSQLILSDELISRLYDKLKKLVTENIIKTNYGNHIVRLFPQAQQSAIELYLTERYLNINKLFRSEPLVQDTNRIFNKKADKNQLACFILGCLLNDAANKINDLAANSAEELQSTTGMHLDRGEKLTEEIIQRRLANPWNFPALTSFSIRKEGSPYFNKEGTTRTKLENPPRSYVINDVEGEVLFAQGAQVITIQGPGYLLSQFKNSPLLELKNHYWSELALAAAHTTYLSKEYAEKSHTIILSGYLITRPNHNITHTHRVMLCTELVTDYFSHYAADKEFRLFCRSLSDVNLEWLRVAAAFSTTGRESEMSAGEDLKRYEQYREASCRHFLVFVEKTNPTADTVMKERMSHVVRYMGNPNYETTINDHLDEEERNIRNYYHRLLTIAHKIDLPRCYSATRYTESMRLCRDLSHESEEQYHALAEIIRYNIDLIKKQGGSLHCDIEVDGSMVDKTLNYQPIYGEASRSMKRLFEITQTVTKPQIRRSEIAVWRMKL